ncbi:MAG: DUF692 domain-containing protein [Rickettsiales bacterium]|nr:MAG: DUF692 domain-containing protein [Rickettsiales bacterium]
MNPFIGIGLKAPHYKQVLEEHPPIGWFEVHSENFLARGGNIPKFIAKISEKYPLSLHGVGLSLGSAEGLSTNHLELLSNLIKRVNPKFVSEHLSWGYVDGIYMPDLLPVPYTKESFNILKRNILIAQDALKQEILIENPSSYIEYKSSKQSESEFLVDLCKSTGAKILLDVNNVYVSAWNHAWNAKKYIDSIPENLVREIHIAGHSVKELPDNQILRVDTHNANVCDKVWNLYNYAIEKFGPIPTLLEWDADIPSLDALVAEASKCEPYLLSHASNAGVVNA